LSETDSRAFRLAGAARSHRRGGGRFVVAVVAALAAAPVAFAADVLAPAPAYTKAPAPIATDWTGFYLGAGVGARSAKVNEQTLSAGSNFGSIFMSAATCQFVSCGVTQSLDHTAFRFSPYIGYNWQVAPQWLVGLEGDVGFGSKTSTINGVALPGAGGFSINDPGDSFAVRASWDASARARLGYLVTPTFLIYATGGPAWQHVEATSTCGPNNANCTDTGVQFTSIIRDSTTKLGFTVGGGIETMLCGNWLLRGEFRYSDFGTINNTDVRTDGAGGFLSTKYNLRLTTQTATFGIAYKFGP
jgi:outer membrane immunogenic protein